MPFFMHQWSYKDKEVHAMVATPQNRSEVVQLATKAFGGTLHHFFFSFGQFDGVCITEFPDNETAAACLMSIAGEGGLESIATTVLMTPEEGQSAMVRAHDVVTPYRAPSGN